MDSAARRRRVPARMLVRSQLMMALPQVSARHHALDVSDDKRGDAAADAAGQEGLNDLPNIEPGGGCSPAQAEDRIQDLPTDTATERAGNGIPQWSEIDILRHVPGRVAGEGTADDLDD